MIFAILAMLGLIFGSFVNALVWRLREQTLLANAKQKPKNQLTADNLSITRGRSMCPNCHHELAAKDLVPVLSWLWLRGKCRYCHRSISWQYPVVELLTAVFFVVSWLWWPLALAGVGLFQFIVWLVFVVAFMALSVYDLKWFLLPDRIVVPLIGLAVLQVVVVAAWTHSWTPVWGSAWAVLIIAGLFYLLYQVSKGGWIGGGDVKLAIVLGLLAGTPLKALMVIFFASLAGTVVSLPLLLRTKPNWRAKVPFGPFLLVAMVVVQLFGSQIANWYTGILL
jgi:prepilin signal peptidase PulO-like enzyme (type II secretory pathway)